MDNDYTKEINEIRYIVTHIRDLTTRIRICQELGYKIGVIIVKDSNVQKELYSYVDKNNDIRIQITPILYNKIAKCIIITTKNNMEEQVLKEDKKQLTTETETEIVVDNVNSSQETETENNTTTTVAEQEKSNEDEKKKEDEMTLTHLNKDFVYELMSVPTYSKEEYRLVTFVILWARKNNIDYEFDSYGNIYLTKGELAENEFYPCVTAHLDSVQSKQQPYIKAGLNLEVKTRINSKGQHEIYIDDCGIGGDDKAGVLIGLSMFSHVEKLKACFFLEEEIGCKGSEHLNVDWFKNVGYVIGYDSPDLNRAAWSCSGTKLFSADFFKTYIKDICEQHGLTSFRSEPFTDVKTIREKTDIICMNFGSGYYNGHAPNEYCVIEDMDTACRMGHAIIQKLGNKSYKLVHKTSTSYWNGNVYVRDEDEQYFRSIDKTYTYPYYSGAYSRSYDDDDNYYPRYSGKVNNPTTTSQTCKKDPSIDSECLKYIVKQFTDHEKNIKNEIEKICEANNIDFNLFKDVFDKPIKF